MNYTQRNRFVGFARTMATTAGLGVVFEEGCKQPRTDGRNIYVASPSYDWTEAEWKQWYYTLVHEIGHNRKPWDEWKEVCKHNKVTNASLLGRMYNLNSDQAQEHGQFGTFRGIDTILGEQRGEFVKRVSSTPLVPKNEEEQAFQAAWVYDAMMRERWNKCMVGVADDLPLHPSCNDMLDKLTAWGKSSADCDSEWEVYSYTKEMLDVLGLDADELEKEMQEQHDKQRGEGEGEGEEAEGAETGEGKAEDGDEAEGKTNWTKYDPYFQHNHDTGAGYGNLTIDYSDHTRADTGHVLRDSLVVDFQKGIDPVRLSPTSRRLGDAPGSSKAFSTRVRKLLQVMSAERWEGGRKTGKMNARAVWKCKTHDPHIFKQKVEALNLKSVAVTVMVDFSGSMGGDKIQHATHAASLLNSAMSLLGVNVEVVGFTDTHAPVHYLIKKFGERVNEAEMQARFSRSSSRMGGNADGESLLWCADRLLHRQEKKKILVVLSDGQPASSQCGDDDFFLSRAVEEVVKAGVRVYGIGICSSSVKRYYPNRCVINNANELEGKLLEVVKNQIVIGG